MLIAGTPDLPTLLRSVRLRQPPGASNRGSRVWVMSPTLRNCGRVRTSLSYHRAAKAYHCRFWKPPRAVERWSRPMFQVVARSSFRMRAAFWCRSTMNAPWCSYRSPYT